MRVKTSHLPSLMYNTAIATTRQNQSCGLYLFQSLPSIRNKQSYPARKRPQYTSTPATPLLRLEKDLRMIGKNMDACYAKLAEIKSELSFQKDDALVDDATCGCSHLRDINEKPVYTPSYYGPRKLYIIKPPYRVYRV